MKYHELQVDASKNKKRVGRGIAAGQGKTAGRGTKGQKARAGHKIRPEIRDVIKRLPKLRGYRFGTIQTHVQSVTLASLQERFKANEIVSPRTLIEKGLARQVKGNLPPVKIVATGKLSKALIFENCAVSAGAKSIIEKEGGKVQ